MSWEELPKGEGGHPPQVEGRGRGMSPKSRTLERQGHEKEQAEGKSGEQGVLETKPRRHFKNQGNAQPGRKLLRLQLRDSCEVGIDDGP